MSEKKISFRKLKAEEIECRVGQKSKDGSKYSVLLYKTARTDMEILDEVFGAENWQSEHYEVKGKDFCKIGICVDRGDKSEWVWKSDCGSETNVEAEKGESSDSFKRAGFQWGIGRELYTAPQIWLKSDISPYTLSVKKIEYSGKEISHLVIESKGEEVFSYSSKKKSEEDALSSEDRENLIHYITDSLNNEQVQNVLSYFNKNTLSELSDQELLKTERNINRKKEKN